MHVIGTAGHIDHGKSTLIKALTGIDPDRLKEEKERGMTIDLGFAWLNLPSGREVGIVDVPGHHRFIPNMLAGVGGISLALFIVAATESWMPQSQEHLDILNLLGIGKGIVVLTKADLVEQDWLEMVTEEVRDKLVGSVLEDAEIIPVSSTTGKGLPYLVEQIEAMLSTVPEPKDVGKPRLWIDRVFTVRGAGTVITGTLEGGYLQLDQVVEILPGGKESRIRSLQTHKRAVEKAEPGARVAVNLAGIETDEVQRGDAVVGVGQWRATDTLNVLVRLLPKLDYSLSKSSELRLYVGAVDVPVRMQLLNKEELLPGEEALAQLQLEKAIAADFHDRYVLRDATRQDTVGGGMVLDAQAERVRGRDLRMPRSAPGAYQVLSKAKVPVRRLDLDLLQARAKALPVDLVSILLSERGWVSKEALRLEVPLDVSGQEDVLNSLAEANQVIVLPSYVVASATWDDLVSRMHDVLADYHQRFPLRFGLARETLRSQLGMAVRLFDEAVARLSKDNMLAGEGATLRLPEFRPEFTPQQQQEVESIVERMRSAEFSPPTLDDLVDGDNGRSEIVNALVDQGRLVKIGQGLVFLEETLKRAEEKVTAIVAEQGSVDVAAVRDSLGTTRKYVVPLMEYFDQIGFTRRVGDTRVLVRKVL